MIEVEFSRFREVETQVGKEKKAKELYAISVRSWYKFGSPGKMMRVGILTLDGVASWSHGIN